MIDWLVQVFRVMVKTNKKIRNDAFLKTVSILDKFYTNYRQEKL